jgi:hypothetical protein
MATINLVRDSLTTGFGVGIGWTPLANGDVGQEWDTQDFPDVSVQVFGTFGAGGNLRIEGSNETTPTNWATLNDPQGNALDITGAKIEQVLELPRWIRPSVTAGDGTTALTVRLYAGRRR